MHIFTRLRQWNVLFILSIVGCAGCGVTSAAQSTTTTPTNNGVIFATNGTTLSAFAANSGHQIWQAKDIHPLGLPLVVSNIAYVINEPSTQTANGALLTAFRISDGQPLWQFPLAGGPVDHSTPVFSGGVIYVAVADANNTGKLPTQQPGTLRAIAADTGKQIWSQTVGGVARTLVVINGVIYCTTIATPAKQLFPSTTVAAFHAADGQPLWHYTHVGEAIDIAADNNDVYLSSIYDSGDPKDIATSSVTALGMSNGQPRWRKSMQVAPGTPYLVGNALIFTTRQQGQLTLTAVDPADGTTLWAKPLQTTNASNPVMADGVIYLGRRIPDSTDTAKAALDAMQAADGTTQWSAKLTGGIFYNDTIPSGVIDPLVVGDTVYTLLCSNSMTCDTSTLLAMDRRSGHEIWRVTLPHRATSFAASGRTIAVSTISASDTNTDTDVQAFTSDTHQLMWQADLGGIGEVELSAA